MVLAVFLLAVASDASTIDLRSVPCASPKLVELADFIAARRAMPLTCGPMSYGSGSGRNPRPPCAVAVTSAELFAAPTPAPGEPPPLRPPPLSLDARRRRRALMGALWLGCDMLDECHDLVGGDSGAGSDAAYLHALLHRREGGCVGELGMTGWANSEYWWGVLGGGHPTHARLAAATAAALETAASPPSARATAFTGAVEARAAAGEPWDPCAFVALCREADEGDDPALAAFARELQHREWELLFDRIVRSVCDD